MEGAEGACCDRAGCKHPAHVNNKGFDRYCLNPTAPVHRKGISCVILESERGSKHRPVERRSESLNRRGK